MCGVSLNFKGREGASEDVVDGGGTPSVYSSSAAASVLNLGRGNERGSKVV